MWADQYPTMKKYYKQKTKEMWDNIKTVDTESHDCHISAEDGCDCGDRLFNTWKEQVILNGRSNFH